MAKVWMCPEHGIAGGPVAFDRTGIPLCPECGQRMEVYEYGTEGPGKARR